jgi:hypothetical protein
MLAPPECIRTAHSHLDTSNLVIMPRYPHATAVVAQVLGRLAALNPAYLLPPLRQTLTQLIVELQYNTGEW